MCPPLDHHSVRKRRDRRQARRLLEELEDSNESEAAEIGETLGVLDDPRLVAPLRELLLDGEQSAHAREAAGRALREMGNAPDPDDALIRAWWASGDDVLRRHSLLFMVAEQRDLLDEALRSPDRATYMSAIEALEFGLDGPWTLGHYLTALTHSSSAVRFRAADWLVYDEPVGATDALVLATSDSDGDVAVAALDTLCYYPTRRTLEAAAAAARSTDEGVAEAGHNCLDHLRTEFLYSLCPPEVEVAVRNWLGSSWSMLRIDEEDVRMLRAPRQGGMPDDPLKRHRHEWMQSVPAFEARFSSLDCEWEPLCSELYWADWQGVPPPVREELAERLLHFPDAMVRLHASRAFASWNDSTRLVVLLDDPGFLIRKGAAYDIRNLEPDPALAHLAWERLAGGHGQFAFELIESAVAVSPTKDWIPRASAILGDEGVEELVRFYAACALGEAKAHAELQNHLGILTAPPPLTWSLHDVLFDAAVKLELDLPDLSHLAHEDHLVPQTIAAKAATLK